MATPDFSLTAPKLPLSTGIPAGPAAERNDRSGSAGSSSRPRGKFARRGAGSGRLGVRGRAEDGDEMMGEASHAGPSKKTRSTGNTNHVRASPLDRGNSDAGPSSIRVSLLSVLWLCCPLALFVCCCFLEKRRKRWMGCNGISHLEEQHTDRLFLLHSDPLQWEQLGEVPQEEVQANQDPRRPLEHLELAKAL